MLVPTINGNKKINNLNNVVTKAQCITRLSLNAYIKALIYSK